MQGWSVYFNLQQQAALWMDPDQIASEGTHAGQDFDSGGHVVVSNARMISNHCLYEVYYFSKLKKQNKTKLMLKNSLFFDSKKKNCINYRRKSFFWNHLHKFKRTLAKKSEIRSLEVFAVHLVKVSFLFSMRIIHSINDVRLDLLRGCEPKFGRQQKIATEIWWSI